MRYRIAILISTISIFLTGHFLNAQHLIFKTYTVEDGLVSNPVRRVFQDNKGFIWITSWEGLSKYDGNKFTTYNTSTGLSHNMVNDIYESPEGQLYLAENDGTVDILQQNAMLHKAVFQNVIINQFYKTKDNRLIAATDVNGFQEIRNGKLVKLSQPFPHFTYNDITELNDSLLIGGGEGSLQIMNRQFKLFSEIKQPNELITLKIYRDSKNKIWVGTNAGLKIVSSPQKSDRSASFTLEPAPFDIPVLKKNIINDILEDSNGNFWIATSHGLVKIQKDGYWQLLLEKDGLPSAFISCIYQDREKNIWIGTTLGLVKLVTKNDIHIYNAGDGSISKGVVLLLPLANDQFMTSTETGMHLFDTRSQLFSPVSTEHNSIYGFVKNSPSGLFYNGNDQLGRYDPVNKRIIDSMIPGAEGGGVYCSVMDINGIIFNGTQNGLGIHFGKNSSSENRFSSPIFALHIDKKGYLWVGTRDNGLFRVRYTVSENKIDLSVKDLSYLLPDKNIRCMFEDNKGNIWIGTRYQGAVQLKNKEGGDEYNAVYFGVPQGITSGWIRVIAEDENDCIWIASTLGIDKLIPSGNAFRIFNFSRVNNFFANINAILPGKDHSLWLTSDKGLVHIIDGENERSGALPVFITSASLGDTSFNYNTYHRGSKFRLRYDQNQAAFEFSAPGFINEKQIFYSYRLLGSRDTAWSKASNLHNVSYASLQPGNYRFEVRTLGWNEDWGTPARFEFIVKPPYWRTGWFYSLIGLAVLLLFYIFYRYRIRQLLKVQKLRNSIASDLHDDIGTTLTNINMLSEISRKNLAQPGEAEKYLQRISEEVTSSSQALNDIIWSVNSRNDSMEETLSRMRRYAAELFDNSNTTCHLDIDENIAGKKINMVERRDLYLIYKESMNNIVKHAGARNVWIGAKCMGDKLQLAIKDDGKGFDPDIISNRNGLKNIRSRTEKWKGAVKIQSTPGKGTLIEIIIPLAG